MDDMRNQNPPQNENVWPYGYRIRVKGCLSEEIITWLDLPVETDPVHGESAIIIFPPDQAALYGAILRLRDLGLTLLSVEQDLKK